MGSEGTYEGDGEAGRGEGRGTRAGERVDAAYAARAGQAEEMCATAAGRELCLAPRAMRAAAEGAGAGDEVVWDVDWCEREDGDYDACRRRLFDQYRRMLAAATGVREKVSARGPGRRMRRIQRTAGGGRDLAGGAWR